jgi:hypothetical protein
MELEIKEEIEFQERDLNNSNSYSIQKSPDVSDKMLRHIMRKYIVYETITDVDSKLIELVIRKC